MLLDVRGALSRPTVELGFNQAHNPYYNPRTHSLAVEDVVQGSPAEQAGLRAGDRIIAVNGRELGSEIVRTNPMSGGIPAIR